MKEGAQGQSEIKSLHISQDFKLWEKIYKLLHSCEVRINSPSCILRISQHAIITTQNLRQFYLQSNQIRRFTRCKNKSSHQCLVFTTAHKKISTFMTRR